MSYLSFHELPREKKYRTKVWEVRSGMGAGQVAGLVRWRTTWRRYVFDPSPGWIFDAACLHELERFLIEQTRQHKVSGADKNSF